MVEFELCNPLENFLVGIDLANGIMDNELDDEITPVKILSIGFLLFKVNFLWVDED